MSIEYKEESRYKTEKKTKALLIAAPPYVAAFHAHMQGGRREALTIHAYIRDVLEFLSYEKEMLAGRYQDTPLSALPLTLFDQLTPRDLEEYRDYLRHVRMVANSSAKRKLSALSVFFRYLLSEGDIEKNPMAEFDYPLENRHRIIHLDSDLSQRLLAGVLANDKYLLVSGEGTDQTWSVIEIPEDIRCRREPLVLRNYAILRLFLGSGLRVSELVGLDLSDIHFSRSSVTIIQKGGDETEVFFNETVADALRAYIYAQAPPGSSKSRTGRAALGPKKGCEAVFITTRGNRMSVRAVELMVKEMAQTYLPDYDDKDIFSPHKLRATCATRILAQTGNVALASRQLNHKGVAVTAAFYAELQKENQKAQIQKLDVDQW